MNRKISFGVALTVTILAVALTVSVTMVLAMRHFSSLVSSVGQRQAMYDYLDEIDSAARDLYTVDEERLRTELAKGYLQGLNDSYAAYLTAVEYKEVQSAAAGNRTGFGIEVLVSSDNQLAVSHVVANSPAALLGVARGDVITAVDGQGVTGASYTWVKDALQKSDRLKLGLNHGGEASVVEITANTYTDTGVEGRLIQENIGYIRLRSFNALTPLQFKSLYNQLTQQGATYFLFDVRGNEGGSLAAVQEILSYLLPSGPYATCVRKSGTETYTANDTYEMTAPAVTLMNGNTSGEAELFAGVLGDMGKARLVGTSTRGKAAVQEYFAIASDKAAVRLSVGEWQLFHSGENWKDSGLMPDLTVDLSYEKLLVFDLLEDAQDDQLQQAATLLKNTTSMNAVASQTGFTQAATTAATGAPTSENG